MPPLVEPEPLVPPLPVGEGDGDGPATEPRSALVVAGLDCSVPVHPGQPCLRLATSV